MRTCEAAAAANWLKMRCRLLQPYFLNKHMASFLFPEVKMEIGEAGAQARRLLDLYRLRDWHFEFDSAWKRFGNCEFAKKRITLSRVLVEANDESEVRDAILHQIAHALAGPDAHHWAEWKAVAISIGASPYVKCHPRLAKVQARPPRSPRVMADKPPEAADPIWETAPAPNETTVMNGRHTDQDPIGEVALDLTVDINHEDIADVPSTPGAYECTLLGRP